jgi:hypothetical protein
VSDLAARNASRELWPTTVSRDDDRP